MSYRGRIAPTPTGFLHLGHGRTFYTAWQRARDVGGAIVLRVEDLDPQRCKPEFVEGLLEDLRWMGVDWCEGPLYQSQRREHYLSAWQRLKESGWIYPCLRSRKELRNVSLAPHDDEEAAEPLYPPAWRPGVEAAKSYASPEGATWRFRVPDGEPIHFSDVQKGPQCLVAGQDFGDFVVWRRDDVPAYELAVVVDDIANAISEVVRGEDLLKSTARQWLLYRALGASAPAWCHLPLVCDVEGRRLAKRHDSLSMKTLREQGRRFEDCLAELEAQQP